jgi:hypothetical protein
MAAGRSSRMISYARTNATDERKYPRAIADTPTNERSSGRPAPAAIIGPLSDTPANPNAS